MVNYNLNITHVDVLQCLINSSTVYECERVFRIKSACLTLLTLKMLCLYLAIRIAVYASNHNQAVMHTLLYMRNCQI